MVELFRWLRSRFAFANSPSRGADRLTRNRSSSSADSARCRPRVETLERRELMARDVILDWNAVMLQANANDHALGHPEQGGPVLTGRAFAIVSVAMYDAYNSIKHIGSCLFDDCSAPKGANVDAAVAQAAHDTLLAPCFLRSRTVLRPIAQGHAEQRFPMALKKTAAERWAASSPRKFWRRGPMTEPPMSWSPAMCPAAEPGFHSADPLHPNQGYLCFGGHACHPVCHGRS